MIDVALAMATERESSPHRARHSSSARAIGSNGRRTGWLTASTLVRRNDGDHPSPPRHDHLSVSSAGCIAQALSRSLAFTA